ncbi:MAG: ribosomal-protein-alanine acetyltransferase, partial [Gammaproteobacteria bacterium]|nr:ribosomal-protein-alanine acetyltransferase [Gammaproteobacteria bacterium]
EAAYEFPWSMIIFQDCLKMGYSTWVLERDGCIIGYSVMTVAVGESHLLNLCVHPDYQRMGHGEMLLDHILDLAQKHQAEMTFLEVRPSNATARRLYQNKGFDEVGMRRNYYPAHFGREDAVIMARSLV